MMILSGEYNNNMSSNAHISKKGAMSNMSLVTNKLNTESRSVLSLPSATIERNNELSDLKLAMFTAIKHSQEAHKSSTYDKKGHDVAMQYIELRESLSSIDKDNKFEKVAIEKKLNSKEFANIPPALKHLSNDELKSEYVGEFIDAYYTRRSSGEELSKIPQKARYVEWGSDQMVWGPLRGPALVTHNVNACTTLTLADKSTQVAAHILRIESTESWFVKVSRGLKIDGKYHTEHDYLKSKILQSKIDIKNSSAVIGSGSSTDNVNEYTLYKSLRTIGMKPEQISFMSSRSTDLTNPIFENCMIENGKTYRLNPQLQNEIDSLRNSKQAF